MRVSVFLLITLGQTKWPKGTVSRSFTAKVMTVLIIYQRHGAYYMYPLILLPPPPPFIIMTKAVDLAIIKKQLASLYMFIHLL